MADEFLIRIRAEDDATAVVKKITGTISKVTAPIEKAQKRMGRLGELGNSKLGKVAKGFDKVTSKAGAFLDKVVQIVPGLTAIGSAASLAGLSALANRFGAFGFNLNQSANLLGMNAQDLAAWQVAAKRAGVSAEEFNSSMSSSQMAIRAAAYGADPHAMTILAKMGVQIKRNNDGSIDYLTTQQRIMEALRAQKSVAGQRDAANALGMGALLPMIQQGTWSEDKARALRKGLVPSPEEVARGKAFKQDVNDLQDSVSGLGNAIGSTLIPVLDPVVKAMAKWLDGHRAQIADQIAGAVQKFVDWIGKINWDEVASRSKVLWDNLGGIKGVAIAIAAIKFAGPIAGVLSLISNLALLTTSTIPAAVGALGSLGQAGIAAWAALKVAKLAGLPDVDEKQGIEDVRNGDWLAASTHLPARTFIQALGANGQGKSNADIAASLEVGDRPTAKNSAKAGTAESRALFERLETQYRLPTGLLDSVWVTESGRGASMRSPAGALGHFQFMPDTAKQYGLTNPDDLQQSATAAARMYSDLLKANHGDLNRALAAYNWGQGNLNRYGLNNAPDETAGYIKKVQSAMARAGSAVPDRQARSGNQSTTGADDDQTSVAGTPTRADDDGTARAAELQQTSPSSASAGTDDHDARVASMQQAAATAVHVTFSNVPQGARVEAKTANGGYLPTKVNYAVSSDLGAMP